MPIINLKSLLKGTQHSFYISIVATILFTIIYFIFLSALGSYLIPVFVFSLAGLFFVIGGIIGPGKYYEHKSFIILQPEKGASFFEGIPITIISLEDMTDVELWVNGKLYKTIDIPGLAQLFIPRDDVKEHTLNSVYVVKENEKSLPVTFTFFEYDESMTDDEIEEFSKLDAVLDMKQVELMRDEQVAEADQSIGSYALGYLIMALLLVGTLPFVQV